MAYVAISQTLISDTEANINRMKDKERTQVSTPTSEMRVDRNNPTAMGLVWGEHIHLKGVLPEDWTQEVESIYVNISFAWNDEQTKEISYSIKPTVGKFLVPNLRSNGYSSANIKVNEDHPFVQAHATALLAQQRELYAINEKWNGIKQQVVDFLKAAKSLNEALKLWPALSLYISDSYIQRVNDKVSRGATVSNAAEMLARIQTDELTAAAVSARLT